MKSRGIIRWLFMSAAALVLALPVISALAEDEKRPAHAPRPPVHAAPPATHSSPPAHTNTERPAHTERPAAQPNYPRGNNTSPGTNATQPRGNSPTYQPGGGGTNSTYPGRNTPNTPNTPNTQPNRPQMGGPGAGTNSNYPGGRGNTNPQSQPGARGYNSNNPGGGRTFGNNQPGGAGGGRTFGNGGAPFRPPAGATSSRGANGGMTYSHGGMNYHTDRSGRLAAISRPGMEAHYGSNGMVRSAHFDRPGGARLSVSHGMYGERRIETVRADHTRVVSWGVHDGYVERPFRQGYVSRTYVFGGRSYVHVYRTYSYGGVVFYGYVPPVYYHPRFYMWAWNPWPAPVVFSWGWRGAPWFGFYGGYFAPAPYYPSAALWLTDYMLAQEMQLAWENRQAALAAQQSGQYDQNYQPPPPSPADAGGAVMLSPQVKQAIAEEVRQQLEAERNAANQPGPPPGPQPVQPTNDRPPVALDPNQRIFVVSNGFAVNAGGQDCGLTPGDIIVRTNDTMSPQNTVSVSVLSSKPGDCPMNATAEVDVATLQEMHNQLQDHVDNGLKVLAENQGKGGLPAGPPPDPRQSPDGQAPPESAATVDNALSQQQQDANQALQEVQQAAAGG